VLKLAVTTYYLANNFYQHYVVAVFISICLLATILLTFIFLSIIISIELGLAAAIVEIIFGLLADNVFHLHSTFWLNFLAALDTDRMRRGIIS
jgi:hypothetical protein